MKENLYKGFGSSLSLRSSSARSLAKDAFASEGHLPSLSSNIALPRLSIAEVLSESGAGKLNFACVCVYLFIYETTRFCF